MQFIASSSSASQEIPRIFWNPKIYYPIHKRSPPDPILSQINPVYVSPPYFLQINLLLSSHLCLGLPSSLFHSDLPTETLYFAVVVFHACHM